FLSPRPSPPRPPTLSLHDALPISSGAESLPERVGGQGAQPVAEALDDTRGDPAGFFDLGLAGRPPERQAKRTPGLLLRIAHGREDRKSTRLNSSHVSISYAVFCLK